MGNSSEAVARKKTIGIVVTGRSITLTAVIVLYFLGGFRIDELEEVLSLLMPVTVLYTVFSIKFIINNRYQLPGQLLNKRFVDMGLWLLAAAIVTELIIIVLKALYSQPNFELFFMLIAGLEVAFSVYAGLYISELFAKGAE